MYKGSLFERLTPIENNFSLLNSYEEGLYTSIAQNLSRIFSTNAGNAESALEYGSPDLDNIHLNLNESVKNIETRCLEAVKQYEPRLKKCKLEINKNRLKFNEMLIVIEGSVLINGKSENMIFKANLLESGGIKVYVSGV